MIYMVAHQLGWKPLKDSYMDTLPSCLAKEHTELVRLWDIPFILNSLLLPWTLQAHLYLYHASIFPEGPIALSQAT